MSTSDGPSWARNLSPKGSYFEGFVDDVDATLEEFKQQTVTTWGTRRSSYVHEESNKENDIVSSCSK